jgi:hypothetical protein
MMKHHDHYHCDECGAEFASEPDMEQHVAMKHKPREEHTTTPPHGDKLRSREGRVFTRRNPE